MEKIPNKFFCGILEAVVCDTYKFISMKINFIIKSICYVYFCLPGLVVADDVIIVDSDSFEAQSAGKVLNKTKNKKQADDLLMNAMGMLGVSYKWGGNNPQNGMDCSGFIQYIFKSTQDVNLPRTARMIAHRGTPVSRNNLRPGDLIFFATGKSRAVTHVGIYIGDDKFIHTPRTGKSVEIRPLSNKYWTKAYLWARRIGK